MSGEPIATVWRNQIPHQCTLMYWGRKWGFRPAKYKRLIHLRRLYIWTAHSPIIGGERVDIDCRGLPGWNEISCYHADGSKLILGDLISP